jgi:V8-like Glu-specific endopeptidase
VKDTSIHPYNGIGKIVARLYDPETKKFIEQSGTAFIVGKNLIATSAHVIKFKKFKTLSDDIIFFP